MTQFLDVTVNFNSKQHLIGRFVEQNDITGLEYGFRYDEKWLRNGFALGTNLELGPSPFFSRTKFQFLADHEPGMWIFRIFREAKKREIIRTKKDDSSFLWENIGHENQKFSALRVSLSKGNESYLPPLLTKKWLSNFTRVAMSFLQHEENLTKDEISLLLETTGDVGGREIKAIVRDEISKAEGILRISSFDNVINNTVWMALTRDLAQACGLNIVQGKLTQSGAYFESRFDRHDKTPLFCLSAKNFLTVEPQKATWLDLADILNKEGGAVKADQQELFKRLIFDCLCSNGRDSIDRFWFYREKGAWRLAPAYAPRVFPITSGIRALALPLREGFALADLSEVFRLAPYFSLKRIEAERMALEMEKHLTEWKKIAKKYGATSNEIALMQESFDWLG